MSSPLQWSFRVEQCLDRLGIVPGDIVPDLADGLEPDTAIQLHGGPSAPPGCIRPIDADYWNLVLHHNHSVKWHEPFTPGTERWEKITPGDDIWNYVRVRHYPFTMNGMNVVANLCFCLDNRPCSYLSIQGTLRMCNQNYDSVTTMDCMGVPDDIDVDEWLERCQQLGADLQLDGLRFRVTFRSADEASRVGVMFVASPFEHIWYMSESGRGDGDPLWFGVGVGEDWSDLSLVMNGKSLGLVRERLIEFCLARGIELYDSTGCSPDPPYDMRRSEVFPRPNSVRVN